MRVTFISIEWQRNGGVASYLHRLAAALAARGDAVQVVHGDRGATPIAGVRDDCVPGCTSWGQPRGHEESSAAAAMDAIRGFDPDVVHVQSCNNFTLEALIRARYRATKTLHVYDFCPSNTKYHHGPDRECAYPTSALCLPRMGYLACTTSRRPAVWIGLQRRARRANRNNASYGKVIVASGHVRGHALATGYPEAQVEVVPYFVGTAAPATPEAGLVLTGGRLVREKGIDLFLAALPHVAHSWRAIVAGAGLEAAALAAQASSAGLNGRVEFAGWKDEASMAALFDRASVVAMPSRWPEPSGILGLEAMAHGRPVVAFATGGIPEWLSHGETGLLVAPGDIRGFGAALDSLLTDPDASARMGHAGRLRAAQVFSAEAHLARLDAIYASLPGPS